MSASLGSVPGSLDVRMPLEGESRFLTFFARFVDMAIVTWDVDPASVRAQVPERFELRRVEVDGRQRALLSLVTYRCPLFHLTGLRFPNLPFDQANYRIYVTDRETGEPGVWFLASSLDSWVAYVARTFAPVDPAQIDIAWNDAAPNADSRYCVNVRSSVRPATLELGDLGPVRELPGFADVATGLDVLSGPAVGFFKKPFGGIGSSRIWHGPMQPRAGTLQNAGVRFLDQGGIVSYAEQHRAHSVLVQRRIDFIVYGPW